MLSRAQQILLKRAQAEAGIDDAEYRSSISIVTGLPLASSSKDPRLTDRHLDNLLSYFEAIHWKKVDNLLEAGCIWIVKQGAVFQRRNFWADRNRKNNTSRDRFVTADMESKIAAAESELAELGCGFSYLDSIKNKCRGSSSGPLNLSIYLVALQRTIKSKRKAIASDLQPF